MAVVSVVDGRVLEVTASYSVCVRHSSNDMTFGSNDARSLADIRADICLFCSVQACKHAHLSPISFFIYTTQDVPVISISPNLPMLLRVDSPDVF